MPEAQANTVRVTVSKDGPYLVSGPAPLALMTIVADAEGESVAWREDPLPPKGATYALCRCGASRTKPYCDGSHQRIGFDGTETASRAPYAEQAEVWTGPVLALTDAQSLCAFARFCDRNGKVWAQVEQTDDPAIRKMFLEQVNACPSGRLVAWDDQSRSPREAEASVLIGLVEDQAEACSGPIWLRGGIAVASADGVPYEVRNRVTLCRCGSSGNKPFCDGSHAAMKFHDGLAPAGEG